jgi:hypothetical protein
MRISLLHCSWIESKHIPSQFLVRVKRAAAGFERADQCFKAAPVILSTVYILGKLSTHLLFQTNKSIINFREQSPPSEA